MGRGIYPTIPVCFWCGQEKNEVALVECSEELPMHSLINYEPCDECRKTMALGVTVIEATKSPNGNPEIQDGIYPTGRWVVVRAKAAQMAFKIDKSIKKIFVDEEVFKSIGNGV